MWKIAESVEASPPPWPEAFTRTIPVPGLVHLANPQFPDAGRFDSYEATTTRVKLKLLPGSESVGLSGRSHQQRNYFWYSQTFSAPARKSRAVLRINKAQFGVAVWLNGSLIGEHQNCFAAGCFDLAKAVNWSGENRLIVRVGAHPGVLPETVPCGNDDEKVLWLPGIYDSVSLIFSGNPSIESVQVAPKIFSSQALVETTLKNHGPAGRFRVRQHLAGREVSSTVKMGAGEITSIRQTIPVPNARLWSPEDPHLYELETATDGDCASTRFGMREVRFDTATRRMYLNGRPYFLRGSNITLHRFFDDPKCGDLPWDPAWVRKLLAGIPKRMHWNSFRFCIGPVPDFWLDIADEAGLLIQNEFPVYKFRSAWDPARMVSQYSEWMRDAWNHPSVALWDAQNETRNDALARIIRTVRGLDLSNRAWENGWNNPVGPDDPIEDHPYLFGFAGTAPTGRKFEIKDLEQMTGAKSTNSAHPTSHAVVANEYGWLWLNRDGSPTVVTEEVYEKLLGKDVTPQERFRTCAYLVAGLTEFWRAHRNFAGVLHFVYLTSSFPGAITSDNFVDIQQLRLEPHFEQYVSNAFNPLGVYINFWQSTVEAAKRRFHIMMVNDWDIALEGSLMVAIERDGVQLAVVFKHFELSALGQQTYAVDLQIPDSPGECLLLAQASASGSSQSPTVSRRFTRITPQR